MIPRIFQDCGAETKGLGHRKTERLSQRVKKDREKELEKEGGTHTKNFVGGGRRRKERTEERRDNMCAHARVFV